MIKCSKCNRELDKKEREIVIDGNKYLAKDYLCECGESFTEEDDFINLCIAVDDKRKETAKKLNPISNADISLVRLGLDGKPECINHGAMNQLTSNGIWRCLSTYKIINNAIDHIKENNCLAGCEFNEN